MKFIHGITQLLIKPSLFPSTEPNMNKLSWNLLTSLATKLTRKYRSTRKVILFQFINFLVFLVLSRYFFWHRQYRIHCRTLQCWLILSLLPTTCLWQQNCLIQSYSCRNLSLFLLSLPFPTNCHLFPLLRESLWRRRSGMISPWAETAVSILALVRRQLPDCQRTVGPGVERCVTFVVLQ